MRLVLHLQPIKSDATHAIAASVMPEHVARRTSDLAVDVSDPRMQGLMQLGESFGGFGVSTEWILSEAESASISHFSVVCRQTVPESHAAYKRNHDLWAASFKTQSGGESPVCLVRGFHLTHAKLKPMTIAGIGEWTEAYLAGPEVWQTFRESELTGVVPENVLQVRSGKPFPDVHQLFTEVSLPPVEFDAAASTTAEISGLLCYRSEKLAGLPDFMHTAEPWANARFGWPLWVVSARVRELFRGGRLRGWAFHPVLIAGSVLHWDYIALCGKLHELMSSTQHSRLEARTW
jgi:hypothetical protein